MNILKPLNSDQPAEFRQAHLIATLEKVFAA
jgi:hypothetical protein